MGRSRSYSPPVRRERSRSPAPPRRGRHIDDGWSRGDGRDSRKHGRDRNSGGRHRSPPTSLLVRNISRDSRPDDLRIPFERFGPVKDVYLPKDYYSGESRGFGFVQYMDPADAADAQYNMDRQVVGGREITVVFAEENRKKPSEMRIKERSSGPGGGGFRRHSPPRSPARRFRSHTRSRTPQPRHHSSRYTSSPSSTHDRTHTPPSPNRSHRGGHESRSPPQRHDHKLSSPRRDRQAGQPRTLSSLPAKRSSSPEGNGLQICKMKAEEEEEEEEWRSERNRESSKCERGRKRG
ncbi:unnamed protein product [Sphagnum jensenii]|uniref:RRM domain-containing protein n=1 Tax=Sphagnum jensenii TaxID=128206 RepID=A0ABP1A5P5_9BRYO